MKVKNQYLKILEYLHLSFNKLPSIQYKFWVSQYAWEYCQAKPIQKLGGALQEVN